MNVELVRFVHTFGNSMEKQFSANIMKQGWCSPKQEEVITKMQARIKAGYKTKGRATGCPMNYADHDELSNITGNPF